MIKNICKKQFIIIYLQNFKNILTKLMNSKLTTPAIVLLSFRSKFEIKKILQKKTIIIIIIEKISAEFFFSSLTKLINNKIGMSMKAKVLSLLKISMMHEIRKTKLPSIPIFLIDDSL